MVRAWFMDDDTTHPKDEHHQNPPHFISLEEVFQVTGVEYHQISDGYSEADIQLLKNLINTHKTVHEIKVDDFTDADLKRFYTEHCHSDDEMRLVLEGCGYYDFRDMYERWIRIEMVIGDLLVIPGGCYHRFTVDNKNHFKGVKYLQNAAYQAHNRPAENLNCRKDYLRKLHNKGFQKQE